MPSPWKTTVSIAASSHDLTTLDVVKDELDITTDADDDTLARMISQQSAVAERYCNRVFVKETLIDSYRLFCVSPLPLYTSRSPISSVTTIAVGTTILAPTDFEFGEGAIYPLDLGGNRSCWQLGAIVVTYVGGLDPIPGDVERAVLVLIRQAWFAKSRDPLAISESVEGVGSTSYKVGLGIDGEALPAEATSLLEPYIRYTA